MHGTINIKYMLQKTSHPATYHGATTTVLKCKHKNLLLSNNT
jgi:hypothetical protein